MVREKCYFWTEILMKENFRTTKCMDMEYINGKMDKFIKETGKSLKCMVKVYIHFLMEQNSKDFITWEKDMVKGLFNIPINSSIKVIGYWELILLINETKKIAPEIMLNDEVSL